MSETRVALLKHYHVDKLIAARAKQMGVSDDELVDTYYNGLLLLLDGPNVIMRAFRHAIDPYHYGEDVLKGILFRGHLRARYNSYAPTHMLQLICSVDPYRHYRTLTRREGQAYSTVFCVYP